MSATYATLFGIYTDAFTSGWQQVMATASYPFRTTDSISPLTTALTAMSGYATQADTLIDNIANKTVSGTDADAQVASLEMLLDAKLQAITSLVAGVEILDGQNLKKAASLDQPTLKALATTLKSGVDATLSANLGPFVVKLTAGLVATIAAASSSGTSDSDNEKAISAAVTKYDLSNQKLSEGELERNNSLSGAPYPYWLDDGSQSTSTNI